MKRNVILSMLLFVLLMTAISAIQAEDWPGWRGPRGDGTCIEKNIPTKWDPAVALWKTELPGKGHASPIVSGDRVFTVTALPGTKERLLLCLDRDTGKILYFGVCPRHAPIRLDPFDVYRRELKIFGTFSLLANFGRAIRVAEAGMVDLEAMVSHRLGLDAFEQALKLKMDEGTARKILIEP